MAFVGILHSFRTLNCNEQLTDELDSETQRRTNKGRRMCQPQLWKYDRRCNSTRDFWWRALAELHRATQSYTELHTRSNLSWQWLLRQPGTEQDLEAHSGMKSARTSYLNCKTLLDDEAADGEQCVCLWWELLMRAFECHRHWPRWYVEWRPMTSARGFGYRLCNTDSVIQSNS